MVKRHAVLAGVLVAWLSTIVPAAEPPARGRLPITISKETTYITAPLRPDGYPDYLAALNQIASKGVTPENNAAVLLVRALGTRLRNSLMGQEFGRQDRESFFKMLGISPPPDKGSYFVAFEDYLKEHAPDALKDRKDAAGLPLMPLSYDESQRVWKRPWSKDRCPLTAAWLAENERPLAIIAEASKRPRFYVPVISRGKRGMADTDFASPLVSPLRHEVAHALVARVMLRLHEGDIEQAWADLETCHRLGRLEADGATVCESLEGAMIEGAAFYADWQFAHFGRLTAGQARNYWATVSRLLPLPSRLDKVSIPQRFDYLDGVCAVASGGLKPGDVFFADSISIRLGPVADGQPTSSRRKVPDAFLAKWASPVAVDWNEVLRAGNRYYDQIVAAASKPTWSEGEEAVAAAEKELKERAAELTKKVEAQSLADAVRGGARRSTLTAAVSAASLERFPAWSPKSLLKDDHRIAVNAELTEIAFALSAYRTDHGEYPKALTAIQPGYLARIPDDPYAKGPFRYRRWSDGYMLYCVGPNGEDDGGPLTWGSEQLKRNSDDVGIRVPDPAEEESK